MGFSNPPVTAADVSSGRLVFTSDIVATVVLTSVAGDIALPDVIIPAGAIPTGVSINRVLAGVSWRKQVDSSGVANAVNVAQIIQVRSNAPGTFRDAINIPNNALETALNATEGGVMIVGDNDISVEVVGADVYNFQWTDADVDGNNLTLHEFQSYLILEYD